MIAFLIAMSPLVVSLAFFLWQDKAERKRIDEMFAEPPPRQKTIMSLHGKTFTI